VVSERLHAIFKAITAGEFIPGCYFAGEIQAAGLKARSSSKHRITNVFIRRFPKNYRDYT
jgi:hypothetical protein